ncbi:MAG: hypothetical protein LBU89_01145 [Fibromonadaceae bacterium]|jgi:MOSC domain-containing protein YiiM|nr:hypothetical protein [Fibromonadaceae bacterium]
MQLKDSATIAYSAKPQVSLKEAAELLYEDYKNDKSLTEFTLLDTENLSVKKSLSKVFRI